MHYEHQTFLGYPLLARMKMLSENADVINDKKYRCNRIWCISLIT